MSSIGEALRWEADAFGASHPGASEAAKKTQDEVEKAMAREESMLPIVDLRDLVANIVICGPSGVGKSTLIKKLSDEFPDCYRLATSHTTRPPRAGEVDGVDYHFVTDEEFRETDLLESATFAGHSYGTARSELSKVYVSILDLNLDGVVSVKRVGLNARFVLILPPSQRELERRLKGRGSIDEETFKKRMKEAEDLKERKGAVAWDKIVVNCDLEEAYEELKEFLF